MGWRARLRLLRDGRASETRGVDNFFENKWVQRKGFDNANTTYNKHAYTKNTKTGKGLIDSWGNGKGVQTRQ